MASLCGTDRDCGVLEIGAGVGVLTVELAKTAKKVVSVELDARLLPILGETLKDYRNVEVINADILKTDINALLEEHFPGMKVYVCANLPYYITSPVIMYLLESRCPLEAITVMVQQEAADRLTAPVGSRTAGAVTLAVDFYAQAKALFKVPRTSFMPSPNVDSAVIRLDLRRERHVDIPDEKFFFALVKASFAQRRKTAVNSVASGMGIEKADILAALGNAGLIPTTRPEALTMEQMAAFARELQKQISGEK